MRNRVLFLIALATVPGLAGAQRIPARVPARRVPVPATELPPQAPAVAKSLAYHRSRFSGEAYTMLSSFQVPAGAGSMAYTALGAGTRADFRYSDHFSATLDLTASTVNSPSTIATFEVGNRYWVNGREATIRPYVDLRAGFMYMDDEFGLDQPGPGQGIVAAERYSRGVGGIGGAGLEYSLSRSFSVTTGLSAMRNRMTTYRFISAGQVPDHGSFWMTSLRYTLGLKFNPVRTQH
jgi:hypothetical protein